MVCNPTQLFFITHRIEKKRYYMYISFQQSADRKRRASTRIRSPTGMLDPKYNKTFLGIFGQEKEIIIQFIRDVTGINVEEIEIVEADKKLPMNIGCEAEGTVDVYCKDKSKNPFLIEIQRNSQPGFTKRLLYYATKLYSAQLEPGDPKCYDIALKDIVVIGITNYRISLSGTYSSRHRIINENTNRCDVEGLTFHFLDLTKFPYEIDQMDNLNENLEAWCYYLKFVHLLDETALSNFSKRFPIMETPIKKLSKFSLTPEEYAKYVLSQLDRDGVNAEEFEREEYAKAAAKAAVKANRIEIAKKMLADGVSIDVIYSYVDLKREDFE